MSRTLMAVLALGSALLCGCARQAASASQEQPPKESVMALKVNSAAFGANAPIPRKYTCEGESVSPPLTWTAGPQGTQSYALICDDPDAPKGVWVHWVVWNLKETTLPEAASPRGGQTLTEGKNSWGNRGYGAPCPPSGTHRYVFKVCALNSPLNLTSDTDKEVLLKAMEGKITAQGELVGTYQKAGK